MAAEPAANLAGDPVAFFAGRPGDSIDAFVTEVVNAGAAALECNAMQCHAQCIQQEAGTHSLGS